jgi:hypothetical protein
MLARKTRAKEVSVGNFGIIYCSHDSSKAITTPFIFTSIPDENASEGFVWPEIWRMPFKIHPLGTPRREWNAHDAARTLPFNKGSGSINVTSVFKAVGTAVFSPIEIGDEDWAMLLDRLADDTDS